MKIELKNINVSKKHSQETLCFLANVWVNGKFAGVVSNTGHGGMCQFTPPSLTDIVGEYAQHMPEYSESPAMLAADFYISMLVEDTL